MDMTIFSISIMLSICICNEHSSSKELTSYSDSVILSLGEDRCYAIAQRYESKAMTNELLSAVNEFRGNVCLCYDDFKRADVYFQKAASYLPSSGRIRLLLAKAYCYQSDYIKARESIECAERLRLDYYQPFAKLLKAKLLLATGLYTECYAIMLKLDAIADLKEKQDVYYDYRETYALLLSSLNRPKPAIEHIDYCLTAKPLPSYHATKLLILKARLQSRLGNYSSALDLATNANKVASRSIEAIEEITISLYNSHSDIALRAYLEDERLCNSSEVLKTIKCLVSRQGHNSIENTNLQYIISIYLKIDHFTPERATSTMAKLKGHRLEGFCLQVYCNQLVTYLIASDDRKTVSLEEVKLLMRLLEITDYNNAKVNSIIFNVLSKLNDVNRIDKNAILFIEEISKKIGSHMATDRSYRFNDIFLY